MFLELCCFKRWSIFLFWCETIEMIVINMQRELQLIHFTWAEVWTLNQPFNKVIVFFSLPDSCRFSGVFWITGCFMTQFWNFSHQTDGLTFTSRLIWYTEELVDHSETARFPGPAATKQPQTINLPPLCLTVGVSCFCWKAFYLWPNSELGILAKPLHFGVICR